MNSPNFSIVIASYKRHESLRRLLRGISEHFVDLGTKHEVLVVNNAREVNAVTAIDSVVNEFRSQNRDAFHSIREPRAGKCRAQNLAIRRANGSILAFFDDDVVVTADWLAVVSQFFRESSYDAMQGPILIPPEMKNDGEFLRAHHKFRTISFVQYSPKLSSINTLTGANMAIRKEVFSRIGDFNEELGPGRSGISEDVEFAKRLLRSGGTIGYEPRASVYHEVDWSRLTEDFFRERHEQQGRSRLIYKKQSLGSIIPDFMRAVFSFGWYTVTGNVRKQYRAKGRLYHYRAMFQEKIKNTSGSCALLRIFFI